MNLLLVLHIMAGALVLGFGYTALYSAKGDTVHRKAGRLFVTAMLAMTFLGAILAFGTGPWVVVNVAAAITSAYLVTTSLLTVRPAKTAVGARRSAVGLMLVGLVVALVTLSLGITAVASGGSVNGIPAFPYFLFGIATALGSVGDYRVLRSGPPQGSRRLARHLWRMSFALFIAAMSFFIGQADEFPKWLRIYPLLALPVLAVLVTMSYWLWRVRARRFPSLPTKRAAVPGIASRLASAAPPSAP